MRDEIYQQDLSELPGLLKSLLAPASHQEIARPATADDISIILKDAANRGKSVVVRAGASTAFGNVIPLKPGIILDINNLNEIIQVDHTTNTVLVEAGVNWADLSDYLAREGLEPFTYPTSRFSTVGGWLNTGGYGINSFRYGHISNYISWIEVVLPDGTIRKFGPTNDEFKYFIGTEGEMGVITRTALKVRPQTAVTPHLFYLDSLSAITEIIKIISDSSAAETVRLFSPETFRHYNDLAGDLLFPTTKYGLFITSDKAVSINGVEKAPDYLARYIWAERFFPLKPKRLSGGILASEVILPVDQLSSYLTKTTALAGVFGTRPACEIHLIDSGKSAQVISVILSDPGRMFLYLKDLILIQLLTREGILHNGKPYGLGLWQSGFARSKYGDAALKEYRSYKGRIDPAGVLNPGKALSPKYRGLISRIAFNPFVTNLGLSVLSRLAKATAFLSSPSPAVNTKPEPETLDKERLAQTPEGYHLYESIYSCARCGSCLAVCPAYALTKDERLTPRGKLLIARTLIAGEQIPAEELEFLFQCLHCHSCEEICQNELQLVKSWDELERHLIQRLGKKPPAPLERGEAPAEGEARPEGRRPNGRQDLINDFIKKIDNGAEYQQWLAKHQQAKELDNKIIEEPEICSSVTK